MVKMIGLIAVMGCVWGCAVNYTEPRLGEGHPGNPNAQEGMRGARSETLKVQGDEAGGMNEEGMDMEGMAKEEHEGHPRGGGAATQGEAMYACPMHPEVTSNDPNARCPKCGMQLQEIEEKRHED